MSSEARDTALTIGLLVAFAALVTVHIATVYGLARRRHVAAALGSLALPPLAPYCAFTKGMRARAVVWIAVALFYVVAFVLAR
jgi:hypothetical protein